MKIIDISTHPELLEKGIDFFWKCWGNDSNFVFYKDCIEHSLQPENPLPKFYLGLLENEIVASYALLTNDIISRQDLMPWFACLYVNEEHRGKGLASELLHHGLKQTSEKGFSKLYLSTDLEGFYEKKGWNYLDKGFGVSGDEFKIYCKSLE